MFDALDTIFPGSENFLYIWIWIGSSLLVCRAHWTCGYLFQLIYLTFGSSIFVHAISCISLIFCPCLQYFFSYFLLLILQLQKVVDSYIIVISQQDLNDTNPERRELLPLHSTGMDSHHRHLWTRFIPANIRIAPFPTREYTDDEFQSIVKSVMGVLWVWFVPLVLYLTF